MEEKKFTTKEQRDFRKQGLKGCQSCGEIKSLDEFSLIKKSNRYKPTCYTCNRKDDYNQTFTKKEQIELKKEGKKGCQSCGIVKSLDEFQFVNNSYSYKCKKCRCEYNIQWQKDNPEKVKLIQNTWKKNNPTYYIDRYNNDPEFRWSENIRNNLQGVKNRQEFKDLWDNVRKDYDEKGIDYHIDHKVPKSWFLSRTPKYLINNLDNLQVIDADYNMNKKNRWSDPVPSDYLDKIRPYIKKKFQGLLKSL